MKKAHLTAILLALCLTGSLAGCGGDAGTDATESTGQAANSSHIYEEGENGFLVDAEVCNFSDGIPKVYEGIIWEPTQDQVMEFLSMNGDAPVEWDDDFHYSHYSGFAGTTARGGTFSFESEDSGMYPSNFGYTLPESKWWDNYYLYGGQAHYDTSSLYVFTDRFLEPKDFAFATAAEADQRTRTALAALGLGDLLLNRTLYIDHNTLSEITPILRDDPDWQSSKKSPDGTSVTNPTKDDWTEADDGYILEYFLGIDGCAMAYAGESTSVSAYLGSNILVYYQESGIVNLQIHSGWVCGDLVEEPKTYVTASDALASVRPRLESNLTRTTSVLKIAGEYRYDQDGGRFLLHPVWVLYTEYTSDYFDTLRHEYIMIDAITGKEL